MSDLILTPNKYLINFFYKNYARYQKIKKNIWPIPSVLTLEDWLRKEWEKQLIQQAVAAHRLLSEYQERMVWRSIIENSTESYLAHTTILANAQQAWELYHHWQLEGLTCDFEHSREPRVWKTWAKQFVDFSHHHACVDLVTATTQLIACFSKKKPMPSEQRIFLVGFDQLSPQIKTLFQTMTRAGSHIIPFAIQHPQTDSVGRVALENPELELQTAARWAYQAWQSGSQSVVCMVPKLSEMQEQIASDFTEVLTTLQKDTLDPLPFELATGKKLNTSAMLQAAFAILQLKITSPFSKISSLLRSRYLACAEEEQAQRCQLDLYLRRQAEYWVNLKQLAQISSAQHCPQFGQLLQNLISCSNHTLKLQTPSHWLAYFIQKLKGAGWPGQRYLSSEEQQVLQCWSKLCSEFKNLDFILGTVSEEMAWEQLYQLADSSLFQAATDRNPPIHIFSLSDAAGVCCDKLWIMGLDERSWPTMPQANPFIPYALQRAHQLPHTSYAQEFNLASRVTQGLLNSARDVVLSHSSSPQYRSRPSPLITDLPIIDPSALGLSPYQTLSTQIWESRRWEYHNDEYGLALRTHERASVGSQVFKQQAACPFQAFACSRLQAHMYAMPKAGLNAMERGVLLHELIETFWHSLPDQASLLAQSEQTLQTRVIQSIDTVVDRFAQKHPFTFQERFVKIERERLRQRLMKLIDLDQKRIPFKRLSIEKRLDLTLGTLNVSLRADRLDELMDGSILIIDYKTGSPKVLNWFDERLDEPQLPLYCLSFPMARSFVIIYVRSNTIEIQGLSEQGNEWIRPLSSQKNTRSLKNWSELLAHWQHSLTTLASQFQAGFAKVDPKHGPATCRLCQLKSFCRFNAHV